jgi:uncharacterized protein DUF4231
MFDLFRIRRASEDYVDLYDTATPNILDYVKKRLEPQIKWYDNKAKDALYMFYSFQALIIVFGAIIPIINIVNYPDNTAIRITSSILGGFITIITGFLQLTKAQESWILFRSTAESLKREYHMFMHNSREYSNPDLTQDEKDKLFVERAESDMLAEGSKYFSLREKMSRAGSSNK